MSSRIRPIIPWMLAAACISSPALGQDAGEQELRQLVEDARAAFGERDFETAIDRLVAAYRIEPNARLLFNVARSYEELDECRLTLVYYRAFVGHEGAEPALVSRAEEALAGADSCPDYDPTLSGRLIVTSDPAGASITVDGVALGTTPAEIAGLPSGERTIAVELDGYRLSSQIIELAAAEDRTFRAKLVALPPAEESVGGARGDDLLPEEDQPRASKQAPVGAIVLTGVGVAGLGLGGYMDLVAIPTTDDDRARFAPDSQDYRALTDQRDTQVNLALAGYITGGVLTAAGLTWLVFGLVEDDADTAARVSPALSTGASSFVGGLRVDF